MITHDFLNSIPGRPSGFTWLGFASQEVVLRGEFCNPTAVLDQETGHVKFLNAMVFANGKEMLAFANYICRVENAIERMKEIIE